VQSPRDIIACKGKSMHKIKAKHKPIKEGY
jgi:hypothetical protein